MDSELGNRPRTREAPLAKRLGSQHVSLPSTPKDTRQPGLRIELGDLGGHLGRFRQAAKVLGVQPLEATHILPCPMLGLVDWVLL